MEAVKRREREREKKRKESITGNFAKTELLPDDFAASNFFRRASPVGSRKPAAPRLAAAAKVSRTDYRGGKSIRSVKFSPGVKLLLKIRG